MIPPHVRIIITMIGATFLLTVASMSVLSVLEKPIPDVLAQLATGLLSFLAGVVVPTTSAQAVPPPRRREPAA